MREDQSCARDSAHAGWRDGYFVHMAVAVGVVNVKGTVALSFELGERENHLVPETQFQTL